MPIKDANGAVIRQGDLVRIRAIPDLSSMSPKARRETQRILEHIVGSYKRVSAFNEFGWPELSFRIRKGECAGHHTVWIEPELLRVRRKRE